LCVIVLALSNGNSKQQNSRLACTRARSLAHSSRPAVQASSTISPIANVKNDQTHSGPAILAIITWWIHFLIRAFYICSSASRCTPCQQQQGNGLEASTQLPPPSQRLLTPHPFAFAPTWTRHSPQRIKRDLHIHSTHMKMLSRSIAAVAAHSRLSRMVRLPNELHHAHCHPRLSSLHHRTLLTLQLGLQRPSPVCEQQSNIYSIN